MSVPREEVLAAYHDYDREVSLNNIKVACVLGMILMPAGFILDLFVYPDRWESFLALRICSSFLIGIFLALLLTPFGRAYYRSLGIVLLLIPTSSIAFMIYETDGPASPYYAGINLVLLMVAFVLRWTFLESLIAVVLALTIYLTACLSHGWVSGSRAAELSEPVIRSGVGAGLVVGDDSEEVIRRGWFANNLYFLMLTGIIVVTGNYFLSALRFREFSLRYELDRSRHELEESNRRLKELDQLKSRFFANISHELRTPLTLLLAPLEAMITRHGSTMGGEVEDLLRTMHSNGLRLLKLINDLLDLVRLDAGVAEIRREVVDLPELLRGLASSVSAMAAEKGIRLETAVGPEVGRGQVDRDKLEKIILNLTFNALKFTPAGGRVRLLGNRHGDEWVFKVSDTGIGISEKQLPHVFDRFWQADASARRRHQGAGIGLALTKELTEVQGGSVSVESQPGQGTTFTVRLPAVPGETSGLAGLPDSGAGDGIRLGVEPGAGADVDDTHHWLAGLYRRADLAPVSARAVPAGAGGGEVQLGADAPCILVADDEPDMRRFLASQLRSKYRVVEAVDGRQALQVAQGRKVDLILLDMMMPEKDGLQVCRELREQPATQAVPIILLTARVDEETKLVALSSGANDFLVKPFSTTELKVRVQNLIASHQLQQRLTEQNQLLTETLRQLKEMQSQLVQAEKLTSLGRLSAGIIHEINNPLNFAATGLYALRQRQVHLAEDQRREYEDILHDVEEGLGRVRDIVSDLRTFTFPNAAPTDEVRLSDAVGMAVRFLSHEWNNRVEIRKAVPDSLLIHANHNKVVQVLVNLLQNAIDALSRKTFAEGGPTIQIRGEELADGIRLSVRDNGPGIEAGTLDKIFDPFYTTKEVGKGLGLGLSICYRIVQEAGGQISVNTEPGEYTEFILLFPKPGLMT
ncbi:MAG: response regulator [Verrucomicrobia bacterium]|nr:response regulator [Verrucomicrobiota bacterium]